MLTQCAWGRETKPSFVLRWAFIVEKDLDGTSSQERPDHAEAGLVVKSAVLQ